MNRLLQGWKQAAGWLARRKAPRGWRPRLAIFAIVSGLYLVNALEFVERRYLDLRFGLLERPASGEVVLVEIDPQSLQQLDAWPWPRSYHAQVLERLLAAGADRVAFDIDFSSRSTAEDDGAFAAALAAASGRVILPAFMQNLQDGEGQQDAALSLPLSEFARHAELASVNVVPDSDGIVRRMAPVQPWGGSSLVSLGALLTQRRDLPSEEFYLDYGIRLDEMPRFSFAEILAGRFDPEALQGKRVVIGATAVELGEVFAVPHYGILPGPMVQALAYESIVQDRMLLRAGQLPVLLVGLLLLMALGKRLLSASWRQASLLTLLGIFGSFGISLALQGAFGLSLDVALWQLIFLLAFLQGQAARLKRQDISLLVQGLELRRKNAFMARIVDNSFDAIVTVNAEGKIASFNRAAERIFAQPAAEVLGQPVGLLLAADQAGELETRLAESFHLLRGGPYELLGQRGDGERFNLESVASEMPLPDEALSVLHIRDITAQRQAERGRRTAQRRLAEAIEAMRDGFAMFDEQDRLLLCNRRYRELHAVDWQEPLEGRSYEDILRALAAADARHPDRESAEAWVAQRLAEHRKAGSASEVELAEGLHVRIVRHGLRDGGSVCLLLDVTEIRQRQQELVAAKEEAEAAKRRMASFLANMSHELRTPLNAIMGFSTMMKDEMVGPLGTDAYKGYASDIHASGSLLLDIINDVLDVSKIEAGKHRLDEESFDLKRLVRACLRLVDNRAGEAGLALSHEFPAVGLRLWADKRAVKQILLNLLSNAIKFTPEGGTIDIGLTLGPGGDLRLRVADTGIGIAEQDLPKALSVFGQIESELARRNTGTGLGLPLAQRLAELHGGALVIDSTLGEGTTVTVQFPAQRVTQSEPDLESSPKLEGVKGSKRRAVANDG